VRIHCNLLYNTKYKYQEIWRYGVELKLKILNDILIIDILCALLIISIIFIPSTEVRVLIGLPFVLFFPGYMLKAALFVKKNEIDILEQVAISIGMSIALVALIGLCLNYTHWGIRLEPVLYCVAAFIFIMSTIAFFRRSRILKTYRITTTFTFNLPRWGEGTFNGVLSIALIIAIVVALGAAGYFVVVPKIGENFSEFYILGTEGKAQNYPNEYIMNDGLITQVIYSNGTVDVASKMGAVTIGIVNHEQQTVIYYLKMIIDGEKVSINFGGQITDSLGPIQLQQGEKWENSINIIPQHLADNQKVELLLFEGLETTPKYSLHFWINVVSAK